MSAKGIFKTQLRVLFLLGYKANISDDKLINSVVLLHLALTFFLLFGALFFVYENLSNIKLMTDALGPAFTITITTVKMIMLTQKKRKIYNYISELKSAMDKATDFEEEHILNKAANTDNIFAVGYLILTLWCGAFFVIFPLALGLYETLVHGNAKWIMPIQASFFYDVSSTPGYELTYIVFCFAIFSVIFGAVAVDTLFSGSVIILCSHFKILEKRFMALTQEDLNFEARTRLSENIEYHIFILDLCQDFKDFFVPVILAQFLLSSLLLCVLGFQLTMSLGDVSIIIYISFIVAVISQLFIFAYGGQKLTNESEAVSEAIYCSNWYESDPKTRKILLFSLTRAQKLNKIDGKFFEATLPSFTSIVSTAASYTTFLQSMDK